MPSPYGVTREQLNKTLTDAQRFLPKSGSPANVIDSRAEIDNTLNTLFPQQTNAAVSGTSNNTAGGSGSSSSSTTTTTTTGGLPQIDKAGFFFDESDEELAYRKALIDQKNRYGEIGNEVLDDDQIRAEALANFQREIDATNQVYADRIARSRLLGEGRLGSGRAIQARRGLLGSQMGKAQTDRISGVNEEITGSIENERDLLIAQLRSGARIAGDNAIAERRAAKEAGLDNYIASLKGAADSVQSRSNELARQLLVSGETIESLGDEELQSILDSAGLSKNAFTSAYNTLAEERNAANKELVTEAKSSNDQEYQRYLIASNEGYKGKFIDFLDRNRSTKSTSSGTTKSTSSSTTAGTDGTTNKVIGDAPEGLGEADYVFDKGFVDPIGRIIEFDTTPTDSRHLRDANIKGIDAAKYYLATPKAFQDEYEREASKSGKRGSYATIDKAYEAWYNAKNGPTTTTDTPTSNESTLSDL